MVNAAVVDELGGEDTSGGDQLARVVDHLVYDRHAVPAAQLRMEIDVGSEHSRDLNCDGVRDSRGVGRGKERRAYEIGRASCRERVEVWVVAVAVRKIET